METRKVQSFCQLLSELSTSDTVYPEIDAIVEITKQKHFLPRAESYFVWEIIEHNGRDGENNERDGYNDQCYCKL